MVRAGPGSGNRRISPNRGPGWGVHSYICAWRGYGPFPPVWTRVIARLAALGVVREVFDLLLGHAELLLIGLLARAVLVTQDLDVIGALNIFCGSFLVHPASLHFRRHRYMLVAD